MPLTLATLLFALLTNGLVALSSAFVQTTRPITLAVTVLPTSFGLPDEPTPTYPATITIDAPPEFQLSAYGAASRVWLAPRSWTGRGSVGVDGGVSVQLYPNAGDQHRQITYAIRSACRVCVLAGAAPYFSDALKQFNEEYNRDGRSPVAISRSLAITGVTPRLVTYSLPSRNGLLVRGAAFYDAKDDGIYEEVRVTLPIADERVAGFLLRYFADHIGPR